MENARAGYQHRRIERFQETTYAPLTEGRHTAGAAHPAIRDSPGVDIMRFPSPIEGVDCVRAARRGCLAHMFLHGDVKKAAQQFSDGGGSPMLGPGLSGQAVTRRT